MPRVLSIPSLTIQAGLVHGFSTVAMGSMGMGSMGLTHAPDPAPAMDARRRFASELAVDADWITIVGAVHGADVARVDCAVDLVPDVDGLVTDRPGLALLATYADCYPLLAFDPARHAVGLAHAGWRGTAAGIAGRLVAALVDTYGSDPTDLRVGIGPGICGRCYEVGPEFAERFPADSLRAGRGDRLLLDLAEANRRQFREAGVNAAHIEVEGSCTLESAQLFSHRRQPDGARFAALVAVR